MSGLVLEVERDAGSARQRHAQEMGVGRTVEIGLDDVNGAWETQARSSFITCILIHFV